MADEYVDKLLTKKEIADRLGLTVRGIECLTARRAIPVIRLSSRCVRFRWLAIECTLVMTMCRAGVPSSRSGWNLIILRDVYRYSFSLVFRRSTFIDTMSFRWCCARLRALDKRI